MNNKYKVLVFDLDDTLIDEGVSIDYALRAVYKELNLPYGDNALAEWRQIDEAFWDDYRFDKIDIPVGYQNDGVVNGRMRRHFLRASRFLRLFDNMTLDQAYEISDIYEDNMVIEIATMSNVAETLEYLYSRYILVIATDGVHEIAEKKLSATGLAKYFREIYSPLRVGTVKPKPDFFDPIFAEFGDNKSQYLLIGNSITSDVQLANNVGIDSCLVFDDNLKKSGNISTLVVKELAKLQEIL
jgi:Predicted hydrolase (HAD superfamily)